MVFARMSAEGVQRLLLEDYLRSVAEHDLEAGHRLTDSPRTLTRTTGSALPTPSDDGGP